MPHPSAAEDADGLRRRARRFLRSTAHGRDRVSVLIDALSRYGDVGIFGGMLRDLSLGGSKEFWSDVDLVVNAVDEQSFRAYLESQPGARNTFGGYRLSAGQWTVDVWSIAETWAFRNNLRPYGALHDLVGTTFFNWDGVLYNIVSGQLHTVPRYFDAIREKVLDINFEPNPSPLKMSLRALRLAYTRGARLAPRLARYVLAHLSSEDTGGDRLHAFARKQLTDVETLRVVLARHLESDPGLPFEIGSKQLELTLAARLLRSR
jgi:hypothetical protein